MPGHSKITIAQVEEALRKSGGFLTPAAKQLGISFQAVSKRILKSERLRKTKIDIEEGFKDLAESKLVSAINNGEAWAICFFLKCKGKDRGYIERHEVTGQDGGPLRIEYVNDWRNGNGDH